MKLAKLSMLRRPTEAAHAPLPGGAVDDDRGAPSDAVTVAVDGIFEGEQRLVGNRFDQTGAEERNRHAPRDDRRVGRNHRLTGVAGHREKMKERLAALVERDELAHGAAAPGTNLRNRA